MEHDNANILMKIGIGSHRLAMMRDREYHDGFATSTKKLSTINHTFDRHHAVEVVLLVAIPSEMNNQQSPA